MTARLDYAWKLREVMATRGLFQTTHLRPRLAERGIHLSDSQVYRLVTDKPERLNLKVLMALLDSPRGWTTSSNRSPCGKRRKPLTEMPRAGVGGFRPSGRGSCRDRPGC
jgi:hypothetical protein